MENAEQSVRKSYFELHFFVCVNKRNKSRSCAGSGAEQLVEYVKRKIFELQPGDQVRVNKSGCLGRCEHGPVAVVYPQGVWYRYHTKEDLDEILLEHFGKGEIVERLLVPSLEGGR